MPQRQPTADPCSRTAVPCSPGQALIRAEGISKAGLQSSRSSLWKLPALTVTWLRASVKPARSCEPSPGTLRAIGTVALGGMRTTKTVTIHASARDARDMRALEPSGLVLVDDVLLPHNGAGLLHLAAIALLTKRSIFEAGPRGTSTPKRSRRSSCTVRFGMRYLPEQSATAAASRAVCGGTGRRSGTTATTSSGSSRSRSCCFWPRCAPPARPVGSFGWRVRRAGRRWPRQVLGSPAQAGEQFSHLRLECRDLRLHGRMRAPRGSNSGTRSGEHVLHLLSIPIAQRIDLMALPERERLRRTFGSHLRLAIQRISSH